MRWAFFLFKGENVKDQWDELAEYLGKAIAKRWFAISSRKKRQTKQDDNTNGMASSDVVDPIGVETKNTPLTSRPTPPKDE